MRHIALLLAILILATGPCHADRLSIGEFTTGNTTLVLRGWSLTESDFIEVTISGYGTTATRHMHPYEWNAFVRAFTDAQKSMATLKHKHARDFDGPGEDSFWVTADRTMATTPRLIIYLYDENAEWRHFVCIGFTANKLDKIAYHLDMATRWLNERVQIRRKNEAKSQPVPGCSGE